MAKTKAKKLVFEQGYEVQGVSPLPHYFEEIYGHVKGMPDMGIRGDKEYFWYSYDGLGKAFYEVNEKKLSAESTHKFLSDKTKANSFFKGLEKAIKRIKAKIAEIEDLDLEKLSVKDLFDHYMDVFDIEAELWSHYLVTQPYRMRPFEDEIRAELKKRVATSRVDSYLAQLTASEKQSLTAAEELDWAKLIIEAKGTGDKSYGAKTLIHDHPDIYKKLDAHYDKYKILSLGDGTWEFSIDGTLKQFVEDMKKPKSYFEKRSNEIELFEETILSERKKLIKDLYLEDKTVKTAEFLAEISHLRFNARVEGFIPLIYAQIQIGIILAPRLDLGDDLGFGFMTHEELFESHKQGVAAIDNDEITRRRGKHDEYMVRIHEGKISYIFGKEAGKLFKKLVPPIDSESITELNGVVAQPGKLEDTVTVYKWGDDIEKKIQEVKKHPILVAGQTRPAMMPLIREAKGIVTDEGGATSHAAIVARELKIPTVINTQHATDVLKTGDKVELDADHGVVRKMK